jgi:hypothetical protein
MTDRYRVYTKVLGTLKSKLRMHRQGHVVTLAMMITGIVMSRKAQLAVMSGEVPTAAKEKSIQMRMRRWVKHEKIEVEVTYMPFGGQILEALASAPLLLAMDGSTVGRGCMVLMVGVVYRKRALPLAWVVYPSKKGHAPATVHVEVLRKVVPLIPAGAEVVLLGDGEYDNPDMVAWVQTETDWSFVLRTAPNIQVQQGQTWRKVATFAKQQRSRVTAYRSLSPKQQPCCSTWWLGGGLPMKNPSTWSPICPMAAAPVGSISVASTSKPSSPTRKAVAFTSTKAISLTLSALVGS